MIVAIRPALVLVASLVAACSASAFGQTQNWPWLGVIITDISNPHVHGDLGSGGGSYVTGVETPGPAFAAGLFRHDIIIAIDGRSTQNTRELTCLIQGKRPGDRVSVTIMRGGKERSMTATLGAWPPSMDFPRPAIANCGKEPVSSLHARQFAAVVPHPNQRATASAASAGTPNTTARNGNSPATE